MNRAQQKLGLFLGMGLTTQYWTFRLHKKRPKADQNKYGVRRVGGELIDGKLES